MNQAMCRHFGAMIDGRMMAIYGKISNLYSSILKCPVEDGDGRSLGDHLSSNAGDVILEALSRRAM
jgi:hypothetical protein